MKLKKYVSDHAISLVLILPGIAINYSISGILILHFHWSGSLAWFAALLGGGFSFLFNVNLSILTKVQMRFRNWKWSYRED